MHTTHYLRHKKYKNIFFDYYSITNFGEKKYILKWDARTIYSETKSLISDNKEEFNEPEKLFIVSDFYNRFYSSKYNEPKNESSPSVVLPMTL